MLKPLRVTHPIKATTLDEAIADLSARFLRATKTTCRVVSQATPYNLAACSQQLINDWQTGKVTYEPGELTLVFSGGALEPEADLVIYQPETGDRFLYSRPMSASSGRAQTVAPEQLPLPLDGDDLTSILKQLNTLSAALTELMANQRAIESRLQSPPSTMGFPDEGAGASVQALKAMLEAQTVTLAQLLTSQFTAATRELTQRLDQMQARLDQLTAQLEAEVGEPQAPQTEAEWLQRIQETRGTVGDYEQYSASHREANAETPLFHTPDWIALCELEWARKLSPTLAALHSLIHGEDGIGYGGADILQQFGRHIDARTGEPYYIYQLGGYTAYDAMWQTVSHPNYSWLADLQRLSKKVARYPDVFKLFGWEQEAIAALERVVEQAQRDRQSERQSTYNAYGSQQQSAQRKTGHALSDHLATLNIGPFTPITLEVLKRAYKLAMKAAHPDTGGSKEKAQRVNEAYEALVRHYFPSAI